MDHDTRLVNSQDADLWLGGDAAAGDGSSQGPSPARRIHNLLRGWYHWAVILAILLGAGFGLLGYFGPKTVYTATGKLEISPRADLLIYNTPEKEVPPMFSSWLSTQIDKFKTPDVIDAALASDTWARAGAPADITAQNFAIHLDVECPEGGYLISVEYTNPLPKVAAAGVNAVMQAFHTFYNDHTNQKQSRIMSMLSDRQTNLRNQLQSLQAQKASLASAINVDSVKQGYGYQVKQLEQNEQQLSDLQLQIADLKSQQDTNRKNVSVAQLGATDPYIQQLLGQKDQIEADMRDKEAMGLGNNHMDMIRDRVALQRIKQRIQQHADAVRQGQVDPAAAGSHSPSLVQLTNREKNLQAQHDKLKAALRELAAVRQRTQGLDQQVAQATQQLSDTTNRLDQIRVENSYDDRVKINNFARVPITPSNAGKRHKLAAVGALGGTSLGFGFVILVSLLDSRLRHADDTQVASRANRRMLGVLPTLPENLNEPEQAEVAALAVHHIRTLLQLRKTDAAKACVFSVTSPSAGSGKSSLTVALGLSFATSRAKTLLIDCDIVGAGLTRRLEAIVTQSLKCTLIEYDLITPQQAASVEQERRGEESFADAALRLDLLTEDELEEAEERRRQNAVGLLEACNGHDLEDCIVHAGVDNLYVLPIGAAEPRDAGELSPAALQRLIEKARKQFDTIIIDTGPMLGSIEASMAAVQADGVIFIVSRGDQKALARRSLESLDSIHARIAGIVFNHALYRDIERSSYTTATASRGSAGSHRSRRPVSRTSLVPQASDRLGPLGSAVAAFSSYAATADDVE